MDDFTYFHQDLLAERNGQWMDENGNTSLWLSQGCYISMKCIVTGGSGNFNGSACVILLPGYFKLASVSAPLRCTFWGC